LFWGVSPVKKLVVVVSAATLLTLGFAVLPGYLQQRYVTFFSVDDSAAIDEDQRTLLKGADVGSTEGRLDLLYWSLKLTLRHPIFGVGPGNFPTAHWSEAADEGKRVGWNVSHNTYTQISSETGIPGAILFIVFLVKSLRAARRVSKNAAANGYPELEIAGYHVWLSLTGVSVAAFFLSLAYFPVFYVMCALALCLERAISVKRELSPVTVGAASFARPGGGLPPVAFAFPSPANKMLSGKAVRQMMRKL
jgi:O-antigen ligase